MKTEEQKVKEAAERASEQEAKQEAAKHEAAFAERESRLAEREARIAEQEADTRRRSFTDFAEGLKGADGRAAPLPRQVPVLVGAMEALASSDATVEFGEGDEAEEKPALGALQGLVAELTAGIPGQVDFSERARAENGAAQDDPETVEARAARIAEYVEDARQKGRAVSYAQALTELDAAKAAK